MQLPGKQLNPIRIALALSLIVATIILSVQWTPSYYLIPHRLSSWLPSKPQPVHAAALNRTLGFEAILALSKGTPWRVNGLRAAANISEIDILIPEQPQWSEQFITSFMDFGDAGSRGEALAWLGHINLLKLIILNGWGSALILEDDVDWEQDIRSQTHQIAKSVRKLMDKWGTSSLDEAEVKQSDPFPYGHGWDVLWMGHCSDYPEDHQPMVTWKDKRVVPSEKYVGFDHQILDILDDGERCVHRSNEPVCTYAYAITLDGARKLLATASTGQEHAFDLMLRNSCKQGLLDCVVVNPQIVDTYRYPGTDGSDIHSEGNGPAEEQETMGYTDNISVSARCAGLFGTTCRSP